MAQLNQDVMTLEAARAGFSQKRADVLKLEDADAKATLIAKHRQQSDELEAAAKEFAEVGKSFGPSAPEWPGSRSSKTAPRQNWRAWASGA